MKYLAIYLLAILGILYPLRGDTPATASAYIVASEDRRHFAHVVPGQLASPDSSVLKSGPYIAINRCEEDGSFKELWRIKDFYSFATFLTSDGKYLVAMGPWNWGDKPSKEDIALSFFRDGKLIRQFSTAEIIQDPSKVKVTASHYFWEDFSDPEFPQLDRDVFIIKTTEGVILSFSMEENGVSIYRVPQQADKRHKK